MSNPEPLRGSQRPEGRPARLLGSDEVQTLVALQEGEQETEVEEEDEDDRRPD